MRISAGRWSGGLERTRTFAPVRAAQNFPALRTDLIHADFFIEQFGCRATQADGAALEHQLLRRGYTPSARNAADIVVVNTCTVTAAADAQARDAISKIRAANRAARVVVTGCYAQRAPEELAALPDVA